MPAYNGSPQHQGSLRIVLYYYCYYTLFLPRGKVRPADSLQVKAATILPLLDSSDPSKTQSTVGTVLSICTAPRQPGPGPCAVCMHGIAENTLEQA